MKIPRKVVLLLIAMCSCIVVVVFIEAALAFLTLKSDRIKYLTYSPFRQTSFEKIVDWKTLHKSTNCSFSPGQPYIDYRANSHGFLTSEIPYTNPNNNYRVVMLGDSFLTKGPHKFHIATQIESLLRQQQKSLNNTQVINLGIPCVGTSMYLKTLELEGLQYRPNIIIVSFFVGNDFTDENFTRESLRSLQARAVSSIIRFIYSLRGVALAHNLFRFYTIARTAESPSSQGVSSSSADQWIPMDYSTYDPFEATMSEEGYIPLERSRSTIYFSNSNGYRNMGLITENIKSIKIIAELKDIPVLFVIIPDELQVNRELREKVLETSEQNEAFNLHLPQQTIVSLLDTLNIPY